MGPKSPSAITIDPPDLDQSATPGRRGKPSVPKVPSTWFSVFA